MLHSIAVTSFNVSLMIFSQQSSLFTTVTFLNANNEKFGYKMQLFQFKCFTKVTRKFHNTQLHRKILKRILQTVVSQIIDNRNCSLDCVYSTYVITSVVCLCQCLKVVTSGWERPGRLRSGQGVRHCLCCCLDLPWPPWCSSSACWSPGWPWWGHSAAATLAPSVWNTKHIWMQVLAQDQVI